MNISFNGFISRPLIIIANVVEWGKPNIYPFSQQKAKKINKFTVFCLCAKCQARVKHANCVDRLRAERLTIIGQMPSQVVSIDQMEKTNNNETKRQSKNKLFIEWKVWVREKEIERHWFDYLFKTDSIIKIMCIERFLPHEINFECDFSPEKRLQQAVTKHLHLEAALFVCFETLFVCIEWNDENWCRF